MCRDRSRKPCPGGGSFCTSRKRPPRRALGRSGEDGALAGRGARNAGDPPWRARIGRSEGRFRRRTGRIVRRDSCGWNGCQERRMSLRPLRRRTGSERMASRVRSAAPVPYASARSSTAMLSGTRIAESSTKSSASFAWRTDRNVDRSAHFGQDFDHELAAAGVKLGADVTLGCRAVITGHAEVAVRPGYALHPLATFPRVSDCLTRPSLIALTFGPWNVAALNRGIRIA